MEKVTDDPWYFDEETGELKRSRELCLQNKEGIFVKIADSWKQAQDPLEDDPSASREEDEIDIESDEVPGSSSLDVDKYRDEHETDQMPTEEVLIESAYLVLFAEWGWDDAIAKKGQEPMADEYKKLAVECNCIQHITDEMADDLTDLLFVNEMDAENFSRALQEEWEIGKDLVNVANVHLVPQDDPRIDKEDLLTFGLGEFMGDVTLSNGDIYSVFRNL